MRREKLESRPDRSLDITLARLKAAELRRLRGNRTWSLGLHSSLSSAIELLGLKRGAASSRFESRIIFLCLFALQGESAHSFVGSRAAVCVIGDGGRESCVNSWTERRNKFARTNARRRGGGSSVPAADRLVGHHHLDELLCTTTNNTEQKHKWTTSKLASARAKSTYASVGTRGTYRS
jgi:hypothetical protein